jgi:preprotein translocase subunit SecF
MTRLGKVGHGLYTGSVSYEFVGRWRRWVALSGVVILIGLVGLGIRGLNLGLEFKGGSEFTFPDKGFTTSQISGVVSDAVGVSDPVVQKLTQKGVGATVYRVETPALSQDPENNQVEKVVNAISSKLGVDKNAVDTSTVGASWGSQITHKAIQSLIIFIIAVVIYLSIRYEWKLAASAIIALLLDLVFTVGIYALVGVEVTPSTVIGLLTILGYSLYDTVVVFDKVRENTREIAGGSRMTYSQAANLAVNQTLVRSINTSVTALLPVASLLFVGAGLMGAGSLKDLALALFIGLATGTYSSIFIATPLACAFKEREPQFQALAKRVAARQGATARTPVAVAAAAAGRGVVGGGRSATMLADDADDTSPAPGTGGDSADGAASAEGTAAADVSVPSNPTSKSSGAGVRRPNTAQRRPGNRPSGKKRRK